MSRLAFSQLYRMENECRTVVEYWSPRMQIKQSPIRVIDQLISESRPNLQRVISLGDLDEFKRIISSMKEENALSKVTQMDDFGWNVFHCCAAKENLDVCCY